MAQLPRERSVQLPLERSVIVRNGQMMAALQAGREWLRSADFLQKSGCGHPPSVHALVSQLVEQLQRCQCCHGMLDDAGKCVACEQDRRRTVQRLDALRAVADAARPFVKSDVKFASPKQFALLRSALERICSEDTP